MAAATVNSVFVAAGENEEWHDVTFAATADTYATGKNIKAYTFGIKSTTGTNANGYILSESAGTFTMTAHGTANTNIRCWLHILKSR